MTNKGDEVDDMSDVPVSGGVNAEASSIPEAVIIDQPGDNQNLPAVVVDPLVEAAVIKINELVGSSLLDMSLAVGEYVLKMFFNNNITEARSRSPIKQHSYRKLQNHPGLKIHYKALSLMVNVAIQEKILLETIKPEELKLLTYSHRIELLVADDTSKLALAQKCIDEQLTIKQIRLEISNANTKPAPGKKKFIDPFIQDIIDKYSNKDFSVGDIKWTKIYMVKKMQAKVDEYLKEIENTQTQLKVSKINLQLIYNEKNKSKENKTLA